jgi:hypothetical protein
MDLFQTRAGVAAKTPFSNHVWFHACLDILSICALLFALSTQPPSRTTVRAGAVAALAPTIAITRSLMTTRWWNPLFAIAGLSAFSFAVWGFLLAKQIEEPAD